MNQPAAFATDEQHDTTKRTPERAVLAAGGIAALLASACCLGPFIFVSIGFGGAWLANFQSLEPFRLVFIGIAVAAIAFAGWRIYRPAAECAPGEACAIPKLGRGYKIGFWIVAALLLTTLTFPYYAPLLY
jgi:mercuric ion transport protein